MTGLSRAVSGDTHLQSAVLEGLSTAVNYRAWLADLAVPHLGEDPLEIGSGLGDYAEQWASNVQRITASEADPSRLAHLERRFAGDSRVAVRRLAVPLRETGEYTAVVAYNVLEHIADDVAALRAFGTLVRPGGRIVLLVPAFPIGMSRFDREIGHYRRYRLAQLQGKLGAAGLREERVHHVNALGLVAWIVMMRLLRTRPREGLGLRAWDALVPVLRAAESRRPPPFGQSLFAVARRPG